VLPAKADLPALYSNVILSYNRIRDALTL